LRLPSFTDIGVWSSDLVRMSSSLTYMSTIALPAGVTWAAFASASPGLSAQVKGLFEQYGRAFGYLATVRRDGGPRVHPVSPVITDEALYCFVLPSPKRRDLQRDRRYALHAYPAEASDDEAYLAGRAVPVADDDRRARLALAQRADADLHWTLFELTIEVAMFTRRTGPTAPPEHQIWRAA
jgi:hypothetical protein